MERTLRKWWSFLDAVATVIFWGADRLRGAGVEPSDMFFAAPTRNQAREMPAKLAQIAPFPAVAVTLFSLLSDDDCSFSNIAACVGAGAALSSCLMRRANAPDLRTYCEANNVMQAVAALGIDRARELSLAMVATSLRFLRLALPGGGRSR